MKIFKDKKILDFIVFIIAFISLHIFLYMCCPIICSANSVVTCLRHSEICTHMGKSFGLWLGWNANWDCMVCIIWCKLIVPADANHPILSNIFRGILNSVEGFLGFSIRSSNEGQYLLNASLLKIVTFLS